MSLHEDYARMLEESRQRGEVLTGPANHERRVHPRLAVHSADLWVSSIPEFSMLDMSAAGVAMLANYPLQPGEPITVTLGSTMSLQAVVVNCTLVESPTEYSDAVFRIQCKFAEELQGMRLLVEVKKREHMN